MAEPGTAREADRPTGRAGAVDRFIGAVAWLSQLGGIAAAALLLAAVLVICQMVFVRYVLQGSAIWQHEFATFSLLAALVTIAVLLTGAPVAFSLGIVAVGFLVWSEGVRSLGFVPDIFYGALDSFALLSIPMFILMGGAIASSRAGADLYEALERWLYRVPGGLRSEEHTSELQSRQYLVC